VILVDSSVWISHFSNVLHDEVIRLRNIERAYDVVVGDLILMEVLRGARSEVDAARIEARLRLFRVQQMVDPHIAVAAARNYRVLRGRGITPRSTVDLLIGTYCIEKNVRLLQRDRDFNAMQQHLGLQLA